MQETEAMNINERRKYIHKMWGRYRQVRKMEKGELLDEIEAVTGMHRKSIIRILNGRLSRKKRSRERGRVYGADVEYAIGVIARSIDYPCAERLQPALVWLARHLQDHGELQLGEQTLQKLAKISVSTVKRILKKIGAPRDKLAYHTPRRPKGRRSLQAYPMRKIAWDIKQPGHFEVDLVHHCGATSTGEYIHTLQMVDVATGWSELAAIYGRSYRVVQNGFAFMLSRLPFEIIEIHPDNGMEFFSGQLIRFWKDRVAGVQLSRSRPYHKNDNRFVEENNHSLVRAYIGHDRLDTLEQLETLRQLYQNLWLYHNFFQPVMRLQEKVYRNELQYQRKFDRSRTPFERLKETSVLSLDAQTQLERLVSRTNPLILRNKIDDLIVQLLEAVRNSSTQPVNIFHTMMEEVDTSVTLSFEPTNSLR